MTSKARIHDRSGEALEIGRAVTGAKILATHLRPNLDAVLAVWVCQRIRGNEGLAPADVMFVPSNTTYLKRGIFAVHVGTGKGVHQIGDGWAIKRSAISGSASMAVYRALPDDEREYMVHVVQAISEADDKGKTIHQLVLRRTSDEFGKPLWDDLNTRGQVLDTTMWTVHEALMHQLSDDELVKFWHKVFSGMVNIGDTKEAATRAAAKSHYLLGGMLAVLPHNAPPQTAKLAMEHGALLVLFSSQLSANSWTLGLSRKSGDQAARTADLTSIKPALDSALPGIFVHPDGYMAGWTNKAPLFCTQDEFLEKRQVLIKAVITGFENKATEGS